MTEGRTTRKQILAQRAIYTLPGILPGNSNSLGKITEVEPQSNQN